MISANPAFCALTGYAQADIIGRNCKFMQAPNADPHEILKMHRAVATGTPARAVLWNVRRNGTRFMNEVILNPVRDATGRLRYITGIQRDVTAGDAIHNIRFALLPDGSITSLDHPASPDREWLDRLSPHERRRLGHAASVVAADGSVSERLCLKVEFMAADGISRSWELNAKATGTPEATIFEGVLSTTAQDPGLQMRLTLLEGVASSASDVILITEAEPVDAPGPRIVYANDAIRRHTGFAPDQLIGRNPRMFQGPLTDRGETERIGRALRAWQPVEAQLLNYRSDNSTFWTDLSISPVADEYGWWTNWIAVQRDETERRADAELIAHQASHDSLTGLANRRHLASSFDDMLAEPPDRRSARAIIQTDLDRFKSINDTFGHAAGDAALVETARRLTRFARGDDVVARVGGDEFLIMTRWPDGDATLDEVAERVRAAVTGPFMWQGRELHIMASVGAALYPSDADTLEGLMVASNISLSRAKQRGRGCANVFTTTLRGEAAISRELGAELRAGLQRKEFEPFFQPQVSVGQQKTVGIEVLMRWRHPTRGILAPKDFMAAAIEAGLMATLDENIIDRSLKVAAAWRQAGLEFGRLAVNLSAEIFASADLVDMLERRLELHDLPPGLLTVEMVEGVIIGHNADDVVGKLSALRSLGVSIDLDDFGTGYASLTHLRRFPVDRIKLDRSFVAGIGDKSGNEIIVTTIVGLARSLGLRCVAEGVETIEQLRFVTAAGCDEVQGFLIGQPMDRTAMAAWLRSGAVRALARAQPPRHRRTASQRVKDHLTRVDETSLTEHAI